MFYTYPLADFSESEAAAITKATAYFNALLEPEDAHIDVIQADDPTDFGGIWVSDPDENEWTMELRPGMDEDDIIETVLHELMHVVQDQAGINRCEVMAESMAVIYRKLMV